jgi:RND family efflux transporter MFP subunit
MYKGDETIMNKLRREILLFLVIICVIITVVGCNLAPKEEVLPEAPVVPTTKIDDYQKVEVIRGDLVDSVKIDCSYEAFQTETLNFQLDGVVINHLYVKNGDSVKKGDILADLYMNNLSQQIEDGNNNLQLIKLELGHAHELKQLAVNSRNQLRKLDGYNNEISSSYEIEITNKDNQIKDLNNQLHIGQMRIDKLNNEVKKYQLIAGIDGVISNIATFKDGDTSSKKTNFLTVYNPDTMGFITEDEDAAELKIGQKVKINVLDMEYKGVVMSPEDLSKEDSLQLNKNGIYIKVLDKNGEPRQGDQGQITLVRKEVKDVLYLPEVAIYQENGTSFVYVEDEGGFKSKKEVKVGVTIDKKVEIISGLSEDDIVILN